jgi:hypothetical protein
VDWIQLAWDRVHVYEEISASIEASVVQPFVARASLYNTANMAGRKQNTKIMAIVKIKK